jgi:hypothetical protein
MCFCLLLDVVTGVSDFAGFDYWMVLVILLGSDSVLGRGGKQQKKQTNKTKICFGTIGLLLHVARILKGFYFVGR